MLRATVSGLRAAPQIQVVRFRLGPRANVVRLVVVVVNGDLADVDADVHAYQPDTGIALVMEIARPIFGVAKNPPSFCGKTQSQGKLTSHLMRVRAKRPRGSDEVVGEFPA